jgi:GntR family transcriptional regulator/MocR family aminotransferase
MNTAVLVRLDGSGPLHQQIYRSLRSGILAGDLAHGSRLPATRVLAKDLGVSRNVVLIAYRHLAAEGYAGGTTGSGTYVAPEISAGPPETASRRRLSTTASPDPRLSVFGRRLVDRPRVRRPVNGPGTIRYDFRYGLPVADAFPFKVWRKMVALQSRLISSESLRYGPPEGQPQLREAIADYLRSSRAVRCHAEQVIVVNGSQQALDLIARILIDPGDRVAIEEPHYPGAREAFLGAGARLIPVPVDRDGLDVAKLRQSARYARLVSVTPSHQFPTGGIMPLARRLALLQWAQMKRAYVVEDDYESEYRYAHRPVEAIQGLDRAGRVIYIGTLSKVLFPALRLGYIVAPEALITPLRAAKRAADRHTASFLQDIVTRFIREGHFERHLRRVRATLAGRRAALLDAIRTQLGERVEVSGADAGLHLLLWIRGMRSGKPLAALIARAAKAKVGVYPVTPYYLTPPRRAGLLLGYAGLDESEIRAGVECLASVLRRRSRP